MARSYDQSAPIKRRGMVLALLFVVALLNYLDRFILGVLLPKLGQELQLSDTQMGFVGGGIFSLIYAIAAIPLSVVADRRSKRAVIAAAVMTWSVMTALCGLAQNFFQLAGARVFAGFGGAGVTAPTNALICEAFEPEKRAFALSTYALGLPVGVMTGFFLGSHLLQFYGWRTILLFSAIPGIVLSPFLLRALPRSHVLITDIEKQAPRATALGVVRKVSFRHTAFGSGLFTMIWLSLLTWLPTFFLRTHGLTVQQTGLSLALILGLSQAAGLLAGGFLGDRWAQHDASAYLKLCAAGSLLATPFLVFAFATSDAALAYATIFAGLFIGLLQGAPALATIQAIANPAARSLTASLYLVIVNVIAGVGSQAVGFLSDHWHASFGDASLARALTLVVAVSCPWSALHFWLASRQHVGDVHRGIVTA